MAGMFKYIKPCIYCSWGAVELGATGPGCLDILNPVYIVVGVLWSGELQGLDI